MNRSITLLGALLLLAGIGGVVLDLRPVDHLDPSLFLLFGATLLPAGMVIVLFGVTRPDPRETTVRGLFGNEEENELERRLRLQQRQRVDPRYLPSPRESVHCGKCYTLIPAQRVTCPRCGVHRRCQACGKPLFLLAGMVRCGPCTKDEVYCDCPRAAGAVPPSRFRHRAPG